MRVVGRSPSCHPASFSGRHSSEMAAVDSDAEDVVEISIDDDRTAKEVAVCDFDPHSCTREKV